MASMKRTTPNTISQKPSSRAIATTPAIGWRTRKRPAMRLRTPRSATSPRPSVLRLSGYELEDRVHAEKDAADPGKRHHTDAGPDEQDDAATMPAMPT
jgi:hypothetical protein